MIPGFATKEGTAGFAKRHSNVAANHYKNFAGLTLSSVGVGTYLGNPDDATDEMVKNAIKTSVKAGINVIDTAINYRAQKAERSVGKAIAELVESGDAKREEIFISTKNGYVTNDGDVNEEFWVNIQNTLVKPGIIKSGDISSGYHCMTIPYLQDHLKRSMKNLGLDCIDLMYLHNAAEGQLQDISKEEFSKKLKDVFEFYESQRRSGTIRYYGMATWECFRVAPNHPQYLSIFEIVKIAEQVGGQDHGFRFIQLPLTQPGSRRCGAARWPALRRRYATGFLRRWRMARKHRRVANPVLSHWSATRSAHACAGVRQTAARHRPRAVRRGSVPIRAGSAGSVPAPVPRVRFPDALQSGGARPPVAGSARMPAA